MRLMISTRYNKSGTKSFRSFGNLFRLCVVRDLFRERSASLLTVLGIALGISVFTAVEIANQSILDSFAKTVDAVTGKTDLSVSAGDLGFDELLYLKVLSTPGVEHAVPVVTATVTTATPRREILTIMGIDILQDSKMRQYNLERTPVMKEKITDFLVNPNTIILTRKFAERYGLKLDSSLDVWIADTKRSFYVRGLLDSEGTVGAAGDSIAVMDIASVQEHFGKIGILDRIDLTVKPEWDIDNVRRKLLAILPPHLHVDRPSWRNRRLEAMIRSFQLNLSGLSLIASLVGIFLVYNTVSNFVVKSRKEIGILRSLGTLRRQIFAIFLVKSISLGLIGTLLGLIAGYLFAGGAISAMSRTVSILYAKSSVETISFTPWIMTKSFILGILMSLLSGFFPAREASNTPQSQTMTAGSWEGKRRLSHGKWARWSFFLFFLAGVCAPQPPLWGLPIFGYLCVGLLVFGASFLIPVISHVFGKISTPLLERFFGVEGGLAGTNLKNSPGRFSVTIASIMVSLSIMIGILIMIISFRDTVRRWVEETVKADLYASSPAAFTSGSKSILSGNYIDRLEQIDGIADVDGDRGVNVRFGDGEIRLKSARLHLYKKYNRLLFLKGNPGRMYREALEEDGILISESLKERFGIDRGDYLELVSPSGPLRLKVAGVFYNYSYDRGLALLDRDKYIRFWKDRTVSGMPVYLKPGADPEHVREAIMKSLGPENHLLVINNQDFKKGIMNAFDQTFAITYALEVIAVAVAILSIINSIIASILERKKELTVLWSLGFKRAQISKIIQIEAGIMGFIGAITGIGTGVLLSLVMINIIQKQSFGWSLFFHFPVVPVFLAALGVFITTVVSAFIPSLRARRLSVSESLQFD